MITALVSALSLQVASIPPALPQDPGPERRAAAAALFPREAYVSEYSWGINIAASRLAVEVLTERNLNLYDRDSRLSDRLIARVKAAPDPVIDDAIRCVSEPIAQSLFVPDLVAFKTFAASPGGANVWNYFFKAQPWDACFQRPIRTYLAPFIDADLAAVVAETPLR